MNKRVMPGFAIACKAAARWSSVALWALSFVPATAQPGGYLQFTRGMVGACVRAFPEKAPAFEAGVRRLVERHADVWPSGQAFAIDVDAPLLKQMADAAMCDQVFGQLDQISLRKLVGMPEKADAVGRDEELTRRLLQIQIGGSPVSSIGAKLYADEPARVMAVLPASPALAAGMAQDDVIVAVAGKPTLRGSDVMLEVFDAKPGQPLAVELRRNGQTIHLAVVPRRQAASSEPRQ